MPADVDFPDVSVWVPLAADHHPHHDRAQRYWNEEAASQIDFCGITALGFVRISTNSAAMGGRPLTIANAWGEYQRIRTLPEITFAQDAPSCDSALEQWIQQGLVTQRLWTDAYLAAFAVS